MTEHASSDPSMGRRPRRRYASPRMIRLLAEAGLVIGALTMIGYVAYAINGATQAKGHVVVPVKARTSAVLEAPGTTPAGTQATILVRGDVPTGGVLRLNVTGLGEGHWLEARTDALRLRSWHSTVREQLLNRGGIAVLGLCIGLGAVLLRRLLLSIADGRPFEPGNAARIAGVAGLVAIAGLAGDLLPGLGSTLVLERLGLTGPNSPIFVEGQFSIVPLLTALLLLVLAEAFRRGTELAREVDGLI